MSDRKRDTIVWLLERFEDALLERFVAPGGRNGHESVMLLPGLLWNDAFRELERCLRRMRSLASQQAVSFSGGSCSLGCAAWHVNAWYVQVESRQVMVWQPITKRNGKRGQALVKSVQPLRHRDARQPKANAGVAWIVSEYAWDDALVQAGLGEVEKVRGKPVPVEAVKAA